ncbi:MAG: hypothetical protein ABIT01_20945, partial [Thermoanaerobaculia bacterium]
PGQTIALGLETAFPKLKTKKRRFDDTSTGFSPGARMAPGSFGPTRGASSEKLARSFGKPLKTWVTVWLATKQNP